MSQIKPLVIMAAGLGSRFGSLKQVKSINKKGYSIMDYSIHDAIEAGFNRIIIIIRNKIIPHLNPDITISSLNMLHLNLLLRMHRIFQNPIQLIERSHGELVMHY